MPDLDKMKGPLESIKKLVASEDYGAAALMLKFTRIYWLYWHQSQLDLWEEYERLMKEVYAALAVKASVQSSA